MDKNSIIGWTLIAGLMFLLIYNNGQMQKKKLLENAEAEIVKAEEKETSKPDNSTTTIEQANAISTPVAPIVISDSALQLNNVAEYSVFAANADGTEEDLVIENDVLKITFTNKGGVPKSVFLKEYVTHDKRPLEIFSLEGGVFNLKFAANNTKYGRIYTDSLYFKPTITATDKGKEIRYSLIGSDGSLYEHKFTIPSEGYLIDFNISINKLQGLIAQDYLTLNWAQEMPSQEGSPQTEKMYSSVYYADKNYGVKKLAYRKSVEESMVKDLKWVSFKQKFFNSTLITTDHFDFDGSSVSTTQPAETDSFIKIVSSELVVNYNKADNFEFPMQIYFGPNKYKDLKALDINLQKVVQIGVSIFRFVNLYLIIPIFNFLSKFISNYGVIILILTICIKMLVFPFTYKSTLSMIKMRVLQPELAELKKKFGKDQAKLGPAQMELYRKAGVNPLGGCLPMLFQMPILIAMYRFFPSSIELRQESFLWAHDLSTFDAIFSWNQQIPFISQALGNHISLFTVLMAISSFFYTKLNSQNTPTDSSNPMAAQMKTFMYIMPFMMIFIFNKFSAALSYYYLLFNLISIAQHLFMEKFMIDENKIHAQIQENKTKVKAKSKWQIRMEDMMKQQQEMKKKK